MDRKHFGKVGVLGAAFLIVTLFLRTTGLHCDENNYLNFLFVHAIGDAKSSGKPFLFYVINHLFYRSIGQNLGLLKPVSIYLFYSVIWAFSCLWAHIPSYKKEQKYRFYLLYLGLLITPLSLLNSTQLMMETALLPVISILFGFWARGKLPSKHAWFWSGLAMGIKPTAGPALALLSLGFWKKSRRSTYDIWIGILSGFFAVKVAFWTVLRNSGMIHFGSMSHFLDPAMIVSRIKLTGQYVYAWIFFVGILAILGGLTVWISRTSRHKGKNPAQEQTLLTWVVGSLLLTLFIQIVSSFDFIRYAYPGMWLGVLAGVYLLTSSRPFIYATFLLVSAFQSQSLIGKDTHRFDLWPRVYNYEFTESGGTMFFGIPIHRWVVSTLARSSRPCVELHVPPAPYEDFWQQHFFEFAFPDRQVVKNGSCPTQADLTFTWEAASQLADSCTPQCASGHGSCGYQNVTFFSSVLGPVYQEVCTP